MPEKTNASDIRIQQSQYSFAKIEIEAKEHWQLGLEAERRDDWEDAIEHYLRVINLAPQNQDTRYFGHNNLAYSLIMLRRYAEAETYCMAAIEIDDDRHKAFKNLGLACDALGRPLQAAICFINAAIMCVTDERAWLHLQRVLLNNPGLIDQEPLLIKKMEIARRAYEEYGGVPVLN